MTGTLQNMDAEPFSAARDLIWSVTQLNRRVGQLLEGHFNQVWVKGEVSNFAQAASGHWYFTIKDDRAAVRAVMFRGRAQAVGFVPKAGEQFEFRAHVTLYEPRGDYQLQVDLLRRAGRGDLHEAFLRLKDKLAAEGLFDPGRKRSVKVVPQSVGVVTSLGAAALRDVLSVLTRRAPHVDIIIYPTPVQGLDAASSIALALRTAIERNEVDTILLVRGGGSLEDLWSFNDEDLARTIAASPIPVISGVGHETDFTIADFVADLRAPTPTAAAELCCRAREACMGQVDSALGALAALQRRVRERATMQLDRAVAMLVSPQQRVQRQNDRLQSIRNRFVRSEPDIARLRRDVAQSASRLSHIGQVHVTRQGARLAGAVQTLEALNPRNILGRGYAIVRDANGGIVNNAFALKTGDRLDLELHKGAAEVAVIDIRPPVTPG